MGKRILLPGGCGFIGSNFVRYLLKNRPDYDIVVLDKFSFSRPENLADVNSQIELLRGDIAVDEDVKRAIRNCDYVVNFAAETHVDRSIVGSGAFVLTEVYGTNRLLEWSMREGVEKYLQISTDEVYGEIRSGSFSPSDPLRPRNPYSAAKAGADLVTLAFHHTFNLPVLITRCTNNYGPFQHVEKFVPKTITRAISDHPIPIYGSGENVRDWIWVYDHCSAIDTVLHMGIPGKIYHVAAGEEHNNIEVAKGILKLLNKRESLMSFVADRPGHDLRYSLEVSSTRALGWERKVSFSDGLKMTVEWYLANAAWWKPLLANDETK